MVGLVNFRSVLCEHFEVVRIIRKLRVDQNEYWERMIPVRIASPSIRFVGSILVLIHWLAWRRFRAFPQAFPICRFQFFFLWSSITGIFGSRRKLPTSQFRNFKQSFPLYGKSTQRSSGQILPKISDTTIPPKETTSYLSDLSTEGDIASHDFSTPSNLRPTPFPGIPPRCGKYPEKGDTPCPDPRSGGPMPRSNHPKADGMI